MDFSCLSSGWNEDNNHEMNKNISDEKESVKNSCSAGKFEEVNGADRSTHYHEPLEAPQGAWIMANESAREKEELEQKIACLQTEINAKEEEIALLKETLFGRDKEIVDLKENLSQLQQNGQRNQFDFVKKMATMDEKLQQARRNIEELEDGLNFSFMKNEANEEESRSKPKTFNGTAYFEVQPSWFDTLSNNAGCLNVKNFPVTAKDLEVMKNAKSPSSEPAEGKDYFDTRPSWFDTPSNNAGCLKIENFPVKAKDLEAMKKAQSNSKLSTKPAQDGVELKFQPPRAADVSVVRAEMKKHSSPPQTEEEFNKIVNSVGQKVNPFSKKAKRLDQPVHSPLDKFERTEVDKCTPPVQSKHVVFDITNLSSGRQINPLRSKKAKALDRPRPDCPSVNIRGAGVEKNTPPVQAKGVPSNSITDSSGNKVNPFSKRARGATRPTHIPAANFVQGSTFSYQRPLPPILASTVPIGSQVGFAFKQNNQRSIRQTEQGFLSRTFNKWFGSYY